MVEALLESRTAGPRPAGDAPPDVSGSPPGGDRPHEPIVDVWSRTAPKYRIRAIVLLIVNFGLFCGLCIFTHWLHVARLFDFSLNSYLEPLRFWGVQTQNLNDFLLYPISVEQTPAHGIVLGLLVASIIAVPITISILYRFVCALPFLLAIFVFAHMPWMAMTLQASCILASVRPFRLKFRFGAALVGLLPMLLYLYMATRGGSETLGASASPMQASVLAATWVLAILAACGMIAAILLSARLVNYRPEAVSPIIVVMFATPVLLFHAKVGADELVYRVLETEYGPRAARFAPRQDATARIRELLMRRWAPDNLSADRQHDELLDVWSGEVAALKRRVSRRLLIEFLADRAAAHEACKRFVADHSASRYVPAVLYLKARLLDTRLDEHALEETAQRELYADFPHVQSEDEWLALWNQYPQSPLALAAGLRLAQGRLRRGDVSGAAELLAAVRTRGPAALAAAHVEKSLEYDPKPYWLEARRWHELLLANRGDPKYGDAPVRELAALDPRRARYADQLARLTAAYPDSLLHDNLMVLQAGLIAEPVARRNRLQALLPALPADGDARAEALFRLADLEIQAFDGQNETPRNTGLARLREVVERYGSTSWGELAAERLQVLEPALGRRPEGAPLP